MITCALEQSTECGSAAIFRDEQVAAQCGWQAEGRHSRQIFGAIGRLFESARLRPADIDLYIVGLGPGSYTGLRIGIGFVHGLAMPAERPLFGLTSAAAVAAAAAETRTDATHVQVVGDARRGRLWYGTFRVAGGIVRQEGDFGLAPVDDVATALLPDAIVATAEWSRLEHVLPGCVPEPRHLIERPVCPTAATLGLVALEWDAAGIASAPLEPIYLHPPVFVAPRFPA